MLSKRRKLKEEESTYRELRQELIDTLRKTHFHSIETYERILKESTKRIDLTDVSSVRTSYEKLIEQTEKELSRLEKKTADVLATLYHMQKQLDSENY
jgi:hypothetical protein